MSSWLWLGGGRGRISKWNIIMLIGRWNQCSEMLWYTATSLNKAITFRQVAVCRCKYLSLSVKCAGNGYVLLLGGHVGDFWWCPECAKNRSGVCLRQIQWSCADYGYNYIYIWEGVPRSQRENVFHNVHLVANAMLTMQCYVPYITFIIPIILTYVHLGIPFVISSQLFDKCQVEI